jgi:hypothetical protein
MDPFRKDSPSVENASSGQGPRTIVPLRKVTGDFWELPDFDNSWYPQFSTLRNLRCDRILVDVKKKINADGDDLDIFLTDCVGTASRCAIEVLGGFCRGVCLEDVVGARGRAGQWRSVWLDDRSCIPDLEGSGDVRRYENPLSATGLYQALKKERFEHEDLPDAARRLIYITDLDPTCIHALVSTASCHQAPVLRNAIYKHLHFQSSIAVSLPSAGYLTFALNLHLPFFLLRDTPPEAPVGKVNTKPRRSWTDLSFLKDISELQDQEPKKAWGMYEAHFSCVVTGSDEWRWVAYGFVDTEIDGVLHDSSEDDLNFDQIASGGVKASPPIWRPRDYWLKVFEIRIEQVRMQWEYLIHKVELGIRRYVCRHTHPT